VSIDEYIAIASLVQNFIRSGAQVFDSLGRTESKVNCDWPLEKRSDTWLNNLSKGWGEGE
jgi:hypothetical protein